MHLNEATMRRFLLWILGSALITPVIGQFFIQAATDYHWYDGAGRRLVEAATFIVTAAQSKLAIASMFGLGGLVAGLYSEAWTRRPRIRWGWRESAAGGHFVDQLYVGEITIATGRLLTDHCLEMTVRVFNGTRQALRIASVDGFIEARPQGSADGGPVLTSLRRRGRI